MRQNDLAPRVLLLLSIALSSPLRAALPEREVTRAPVARPDSGVRRSITYFANYPHDPTLPANLAMLIDACEKGYLTHVVLGLFHLDWLDRAGSKEATLSLNGTYLDDPRLAPIWETVKVVQARGVKVIASFGGGGTGDFRQILDPDDRKWYPLIRAMLRDRQLDGIDLDIEENDIGNDGHPLPGKKGVMSTRSLRRILRMLRGDLGGTFLITAAPVASALSHGGSMSPWIDYATLLDEGWFDWYHLQFYNGWGDLLGYGDGPDYEGVLRANPAISAERFVAGVPTSTTAADSDYHDVAALAGKFARLSRDVPRFGGVYGWTFTDALAGGRCDPVGWTRRVSEALGTTLPRPPRPEPARAAASLYVYRELGDACAIATAVNANGDVAGWLQRAQHAFAAPRDGSIGELTDEIGSQTTAIDDEGHIAGWFVNGSHDPRAFYTDLACTTGPGACWHDLGTLGGTQAEAGAIAGGLAVGWSRNANRIPRAFVTSLTGGAMQDLGTLGGPASQATAISTHGEIAGWAQESGGRWQAFLKRAGESMEPLVTAPTSQATALSTIPYGGDTFTRTVGWLLAPGGFEAWLEADGSVKNLGTLIGAQGGATGVNAKGEVVGWYLTAEGTCRAFRYDPRAGSSLPQDLDTLTAGVPPGDSLMIATAVNPEGWIVGQTRAGKAFLLTPNVSRP